jgi:hypothetical protein
MGNMELFSLMERMKNLSGASGVDISYKDGWRDEMVFRFRWSGDSKIYDYNYALTKKQAGHWRSDIFDYIAGGARAHLQAHIPNSRTANIG